MHDFSSVPTTPVEMSVSIKSNGTQSSPLTYTTAQVSADYNLEATSAQVVPITVPSSGSFLATLNFNATFNGAIRFLPNGCIQNDTAAISTKVVSDTLRSVAIPSSGYLILQSFTTALRISVTVDADTTITCSTSATVPSQCANRLFSPVYNVDYVPQTYINQVNTAINNFAAAFPADVASNSSCYNAFLTELCNTAVPRCNGNGELLTGYACHASCITVFASRGCAGPIASALCSYQQSCTGIDWLEAMEPNPVPPLAEPVTAPMATPVVAPSSVQVPMVAPVVAPSSAQAPISTATPSAGPVTTSPPSISAPSQGSQPALAPSAVPLSLNPVADASSPTSAAAPTTSPTPAAPNPAPTPNLVPPTAGSQPPTQQPISHASKLCILSLASTLVIMGAALLCC